MGVNAVGTVNYGSGEYFTLGLGYPNQVNPPKTEEAFKQASSVIEEFENENNSKFFEIKIALGYYEGFYIEFNTGEYFGIEFDGEEEQEIAYADFANLRHCINELLRIDGIVVVHPGWTTAYLSHKDSPCEVEQALDKMSMDLYLNPIDVGVKL